MSPKTVPGQNPGTDVMVLQPLSVCFCRVLRTLCHDPRDVNAEKLVQVAAFYDIDAYP